MAKVRGPLYSIDARGQIAQAMVFGGWKGIKWVREQFIPQNPNTVLQQAIRLIFIQSIEGWHTTTAQQKIDWQTAIENKGYTMSGFNFYVSEYIKDMRAGETPSNDPPAHLL